MDENSSIEGKERPSNLINNSVNSDNSQLITDPKLPIPRTNITNKDKNKIKQKVNELLKVGNEEIMNFKEVSIKKSLFFRLYVSGSIEYGNFNSDEPIKTKYEFVAGESWEKEDGLVSGETQFSCTGEGLYNYYSYGHPFEISYRSINPFGWPQLVLNCCTIDSNGNEIVKGYGCVHVPASTGRHIRKVHIFNVTEGSSFWNKFCGDNMKCCGNEKTNEVTNTPKVISSGQGRDISRATCEGWINVTFQIGFRDMDKFGLVVK